MPDSQDKPAAVPFMPLWYTNKMIKKKHHCFTGHTVHMAQGFKREYCDKTGQTPGIKTCVVSSFCISKKGQACEAPLWEDVQQKLPICCKHRDESWNVE